MRFRTWNIRSLHRSCQLATAARELVRCKLDLVGVQEVRWDKVGLVKEEVIFFSIEKETTVLNWEQGTPSIHQEKEKKHLSKDRFMRN
jgi:exonuclease III